MTAVPPPVEVRETHVSALFFVGDRVYKLKKPVQLDFLDFTDRATRRDVCRRELELNRRLAPDVYLDVVDVVGSDGAPIDHLLAMRRMPELRRLSTLVERGDADECVHQVARVIASFHARCDTAPEISGVATADRISTLWESSFTTMRPYAGVVLDPAVLDETERLADRYVRGRQRLFAQRIADGMIRDGHGDLQADDIFCLDDGPRILDCIEFDDQLRYGDVLADVAFLAMDLERLGARPAARRLMDWYRELSGEHHPATLEHHYIAARALVRAKVACLRTDQGDTDSVEQARRLLALTRDHLRAATVALVLVGGPPGTGKSTLAEGLASRYGWALLRSDEIRKDLAGIAHTARTGAGFGQGIYAADATSATYDSLLERARALLELGLPTVVDASWADRQWRSRAEQLAADTSSTLVELRCDAPVVVVAARVARRAAAGLDPSDATPAVAAHMRATFDAWPDAMVVHTDVDPETALVAAATVVSAAVGAT